MVVLSKLISHYYEETPNSMKYFNFIVKPYTGISGEGLGGKEEDRVVSEKQKSKKKIDALILKNKKLFSKNYYARSCTCQKQPVIVAEEDVEDWKKYEYNGKKRNVVLFPPEESIHRVPKEYYTCPDDEYTTLTLRQNPDPTSDYPLIPCCNISSFPEDLYRDYDKIRENPNKYWIKVEEYRGKGKDILKTNKVLSTDRLGYLPDFVDSFLRDIDNRKFIRQGVAKNSTSSLIHIMLRSFPDIYKMIKINNPERMKQLETIKTIYEYYSKFQNIGEKNNYIAKLRFYISKNYLVKEICSQETFQFTKDETIEYFYNVKKTIDSMYFYKILEHVFCANIFVFVYDKDRDKTYLETPNHEKYHIREVREELPCVLVLKHIQRNRINVYEMIRGEKKLEETNSLSVFPVKFTKYIRNYLLNKSYYVIDTAMKTEIVRNKSDSEVEVRKNPYSNINWNKIFKDYKIISQFINSSGRCFAFNLQYRENKTMTIYCQPTFPFYLPETSEIHRPPKIDITRMFGKDFIKGEEGIWYTINDIKYGMFIPCQEYCTGGKKCKDYILTTQKGKIDRSYENIKICKKNTIIFIQLFRWLFLLSDRNYQQFKEDHMVRDTKLQKSVLSSAYIRIPYRFPNNITTVEEGINYLSGYVPRVFGDDKIFLYPELYDSVDRNTLNYLKKYEDLELIKPNVIGNIYNTIEDFDSQKFSKIIFGLDKYKIWKNKILEEQSNRNFINEEEDICKELPYIWRNSRNGTVYFVQNNLENSKTCALVTSLFWNLVSYNIGYNVKLSNIWIKMRQIKKEVLMKEFGWNLEVFRNFIKEKTMKDIYFLDNDSYLNFLLQNKVPYENMKEYSYIVYSKVGNKYSITEKYIIDNRTPLELYRYAEGGYAALLDVV